MAKKAFAELKDRTEDAATSTQESSRTVTKILGQVKSAHADIEDDLKETEAEDAMAGKRR